MGLFGKSDKEKEREAAKAHEDARAKMQAARARAAREKAAATAAKAAKPATAPAAVPGAAAATTVKASTGAATAGAGSEYVVKRGDSLSKIAKEQLGNAN